VHAEPTTQEALRIQLLLKLRQIQ